MLALAAAVHIAAGRVKITAEALSKAEPHRHSLGGVLDGVAGSEDDPLRTAALIGVAVALDWGGSRGRSWVLGCVSDTPCWSFGTRGTTLSPELVKTKQGEALRSGPGGGG